MQRPLVGVIVGSRSDFNVMRRGLETLRVMGIPYVFEVASPHRNPERVARFASSAGERGLEVLIAGAGGNGQLPGTLACYTTLPVIGVPVDATPMRGEDALLGIVQMPPGTPVATVGINQSENAAILAVQILALKHARFREVLAHRRMNAVQKLDKLRHDLQTEYPDLTDPNQTSPLRLVSGDEPDTDPGNATEEATPEPPEDRSDRIRPGAVLTDRGVKRMDPAHLVRTPMPQEPASAASQNATEDKTPEVPALRTRSGGKSEAEQDTLDGPPPPDTRQVKKLAKAQPERPQASLSPETPAGVMERLLEREPPAPPGDFVEVPDDVDTRVFKVDANAPDVNVLEHAMLVILEGGIVAIPTDTVYGLAADATNPTAVARLLSLKGRDPSRKSLSLLVGDVSALDTLVNEVPGPLERVLDEFWPGGLTVLFERRPTVLADVTESRSIGIRVPADPVALQLLQMVTRPLAVINTAMGRGGAATTPEDVLARFSGRIECVIDAGKCKEGGTSTVLSVLTEPFEILREGSVPRSELASILQDRLK